MWHIDSTLNTQLNDFQMCCFSCWWPADVPGELKEPQREDLNAHPMCYYTLEFCLKIPQLRFWNNVGRCYSSVLGMLWGHWWARTALRGIRNDRCRCETLFSQRPFHKLTRIPIWGHSWRRNNYCGVRQWALQQREWGTYQVLWLGSRHDNRCIASKKRLFFFMRIISSRRHFFLGLIIPWSSVS